jgi:asparagine synthase (glutamine-hydrolysing)
VWVGPNLVLGHRRLSIIDTSSAGNQPFFSADKQLVMVFNGEIYNYLELKQELSSEFEFQTATDTEVILAAYLKWGMDCLHKLVGMFAFALWDSGSETLFVARDRVGVKPIYYTRANGELIFSSEIRAIIKSGKIEPKLDADALADYLRYQTVHAPKTILNQVFMVKPGHYLEVKHNEVREKQYWSYVQNAHPLLEKSAQEIKTDVRALLRSSVELRMRADVPFGAFLSGGIDSSIVVGLMAEVSAHPVKTFSITFHEKEFDEGAYSQLIAKRFHTEHTDIRLHASAFLDALPDALRAMDHPSGDGPNTFVVSKVTRAAGVKMALSGIGGDELFAGYEIFKRIKRLEENKLLQHTPRVLRQLGAGFLQRLKPSVAGEKIAATLRAESMGFEHVYPQTRRVFQDANVHAMLRSKPPLAEPVSSLCAVLEKSKLPLLSKVSVAEMETYMTNVLLRDTDQMSMAHSLEVREPFLDHRLIEYVLGIPDDVKYPHTPKQLLVDAVEGLIPREIVDRPKMGFTFPWAIWMRNELKDFCESNLRVLDAHHMIHEGEVMSLWQRFLIGDKRITWSRVWPLVVLGFWIKENNVR